jgi:N-acetylglucosamine kinase-like BadF-type ATPase
VPVGLGIDGGGSATRWALGDAGGALIAQGELPGISGHLFRPAEVARLEAVAASLRAASGGIRPARVVAGITGISADTAEAGTAAAILGQAIGLDPGRVRVMDDMWLAYHAAFQPGEGHVVYAGTGSIALHIRADGSVLRIGGRGWIVDDAGSAAWIGREALKLVWRRLDEDPGAADMALARALSTAIGGCSWEAVRAYVYGGGRTEMAALARSVAAADDADARAILADAGRELARLAMILVRREGARPVALLGRAATLHPAIEQGFRAAAPDIDMRLAAPDAAGAAARLACAEV